jgi:hypothetical protein
MQRFTIDEMMSSLRAYEYISIHNGEKTETIELINPNRILNQQDSHDVYKIAYYDPQRLTRISYFADHGAVMDKLQRWSLMQTSATDAIRALPQPIAEEIVENYQWLTTREALIIILLMFKSNIRERYHITPIVMRISRGFFKIISRH